MRFEEGAVGIKRDYFVTESRQTVLILGDWLQLEAAVMVVRSNQRQPSFRCQLGFLAAVLVIVRGVTSQRCCSRW